MINIHPAVFLKCSPFSSPQRLFPTNVVSRNTGALCRQVSVAQHTLTQTRTASHRAAQCSPPVERAAGATRSPVPTDENTVTFRKAASSDAWQILDLLRENENLVTPSIQEVLSWISRGEVTVAVAAADQHGATEVVGAIRVALLLDDQSRAEAFDRFRLTKLLHDNQSSENRASSHTLQDTASDETGDMKSMQTEHMFVVYVGALICKDGLQGSALLRLFKFAGVTDLSHRIRELQQNAACEQIESARHIGFLFGTRASEPRLAHVSSRYLRKLVQLTWPCSVENDNRKQWHFSHDAVRPDGIKGRGHFIFNEINTSATAE